MKKKFLVEKNKKQNMWSKLKENINLKFSNKIKFSPFFYIILMVFVFVFVIYWLNFLLPLEERLKHQFWPMIIALSFSGVLMFLFFNIVQKNALQKAFLFNLFLAVFYVLLFNLILACFMGGRCAVGNFLEAMANFINSLLSSYTGYLILGISFWGTIMFPLRNEKYFQKLKYKYQFLFLFATFAILFPWLFYLSTASNIFFK